MENELKEPAPKYNYITPDEYLAMERASEEKHEYYDGFVITMSGARLRHNRVARNLYAKIGSFLEDKECEQFPSDMRVNSPNRDAYMYPDLSIVCGEPQLEDDKFDTLLNPSVIFEIWSPSTQRNDRGYKLTYYKNIPSLNEYIMVDTAKRFIVIVRRQADGAWRFEDIDNSVGDLFIQTIGFNISFDDIYAKTGL